MIATAKPGPDEIAAPRAVQNGTRGSVSIASPPAARGIRCPRPHQSVRYCPAEFPIIPNQLPEQGNLPTPFGGNRSPEAKQVRIGRLCAWTCPAFISPGDNRGWAR